VVLDARKVPALKAVRKAVPEKYSLGAVVVDAAGTVDKKDGEFVLTLEGTDRIWTLKKREGDPPERGEEPYARLKRLYNDGFSRFRVTADLAGDEKSSWLEVRSAELADKK
jgi:hypothetical protein